MNNKVNNINSPAMPTMPIQDKLGQIIMAVGLSKFEYAVIQIAASMAGNLDENILPETIAQISMERARAIFEEMEQQEQENNIVKSSIIK
jgi:hypothetical protein